MKHLILILGFIIAVFSIACSDDNGSSVATTPIDPNCQYASPYGNNQWQYNGNIINCAGFNNFANQPGLNNQYVNHYSECGNLYAIQMGYAFICVSYDILISYGIQPQQGVSFYTYYSPGFQTSFYYPSYGYGNSGGYDQTYCALTGGLTGAGAGAIINGGEGALIGAVAGAILGAVACKD